MKVKARKDGDFFAPRSVTLTLETYDEWAAVQNAGNSLYTHTIATDSLTPEQKEILVAMLFTIARETE